MRITIVKISRRSEFTIYYFICCCLQALLEIPGHAKDIVILLALYREVAVPQGMWSRNQHDVCCVFLISYLIYGYARPLLVSKSICVISLLRAISQSFHTEFLSIPPKKCQ